jgi:phosphorylcholine metabolism protein LicD
MNTFFEVAQEITMLREDVDALTTVIESQGNAIKNIEKHNKDLEKYIKMLIKYAVE